MTITERSDLAEPTRRSFGLLLAGLRRRVGWTQEELAALWGKSTPTIKRIEAGRSQPDLDALRHLAKLLGGTAADLVALTDDLAQVLARAAADASIDLTGPSATLAGLVDLWMDGLEWTPTAAEARTPRLPRRGATGPEDYSLSPTAPLIASEPRAPRSLEAILAEHSPTEVDSPAAETPRETRADAARQGLVEGVISGLMSGRAVVGARFPGTLDAGALVAELLCELAGGSGGALPVLLVTNSEGVADAALARTRQLLPGLSRAAVREGDEPPWVDFAIGTERAASEWLPLQTANRPDWRTVVVDGVDIAEGLGIGTKPVPQHLMGVSVVVLADALDVEPDGLKRLLGRPPDADLSVGSAMLRGALPILQYGLVADPVDHDSVPTHIRWFHPGKAGEALSKDGRLEALLKAGAFQHESNCLIHVADAAQADWAREWLKRRLDRTVEPAQRLRARGRKGAIRETEPKEVQQEFTAFARTDRPTGAPERLGKTWICLRAQPPRSPVRELDEVLFLDVAFPKRFLRQLGDALKRTRDGEVLHAWDLFGHSNASWKRAIALMEWLGARADGETTPELFTPFVTMVETGGSPATVTSPDDVLALIGEGRGE